MGDNRSYGRSAARGQLAARKTRKSAWNRLLTALYRAGFEGRVVVAADVVRVGSDVLPAGPQQASTKAGEFLRWAVKQGHMDSGRRLLKRSTTRGGRKKRLDPEDIARLRVAFYTIRSSAWTREDWINVDVLESLGDPFTEFERSVLGHFLANVLVSEGELERPNGSYKLTNAGLRVQLEIRGNGPEPEVGVEPEAVEVPVETAPEAEEPEAMEAEVSPSVGEPEGPVVRHPVRRPSSRARFSAAGDPDRQLRIALVVLRCAGAVDKYVYRDELFPALREQFDIPTDLPGQAIGRALFACVNAGMLVRADESMGGAPEWCYAVPGATHQRMLAGEFSEVPWDEFRVPNHLRPQPALEEPADALATMVRGPGEAKISVRRDPQLIPWLMLCIAELGRGVERAGEVRHDDLIDLVRERAPGAAEVTPNAIGRAYFALRNDGLVGYRDAWYPRSVKFYCLTTDGWQRLLAGEFGAVPWDRFDIPAEMRGAEPMVEVEPLSALEPEPESAMPVPEPEPEPEPVRREPRAPRSTPAQPIILSDRFSAAENPGLIPWILMAIVRLSLRTGSGFSPNRIETLDDIRDSIRSLVPGGMSATEAEMSGCFRTMGRLGLIRRRQSRGSLWGRADRRQASVAYSVTDDGWAALIEGRYGEPAWTRFGIPERWYRQG